MPAWCHTVFVTVARHKYMLLNFQLNRFGDELLSQKTGGRLFHTKETKTAP